MVEDNIFYGRPATIKSQKSLFRNWIEPYLPTDLSVLQSPEKILNEEYLVKLINCWQTNELKPGTIRLLSAIFKRYVHAKTGKEIKAPRLTRTLQNYNQERIKAWTKDQARIALETAKSIDTNLYPLLLIGLHTGMRPGEIMALRGKDVDLLKRRISVVNTKTGKPRTIKMTHEVETTISAFIRPGKEEERLFKGKVQNENLQSLCRYAKLPVLTFHGLRHTFATLALESGWSPRDVAKVLGHNKVSTTLDYYWQSINDDLEVEFYGISNST